MNPCPHTDHLHMYVPICVPMHTQTPLFYNICKEKIWRVDPELVSVVCLCNLWQTVHWEIIILR